MKKPKKEKLPSWDLSQYYTSYSDSQIDIDLKEGRSLVSSFVSKYCQKVANLSEAEISNAIKSLESLSMLLYKPNRYLSLLEKAGGKDKELIIQAQSRIVSITDQISTDLLFWEIELGNRPDLLKLSHSKTLGEYRNYLMVIAESSPHRLPVEVEKALGLKTQSSFDSWVSLYDKLYEFFYINNDFGNGEYSFDLNDLFTLSNNNKRSIRKSATKLLNGGYEHHEELFLDTYNNIILDCKIDNTLYNYKNPVDVALSEDQVSQKYLDTLVSSLRENVTTYREFILLKKEMLGIKTMMDYDILVDLNLGKKEEKEYTWLEAKTIILEALQGFDQDFYSIAKELFDKNVIDAQWREGKTGGAFMGDFAPGYLPMVFTHFNGNLRSVLSLAHEIGHAIHSELTFRKQSYFNCDYPHSISEIASLYCENLVFDYILNGVDDPRQRLNILMARFQEESHNLYIAGLGRYLFEKKMHESHKNQGSVLAEQARSFWLEEYYGVIFGDSVKVSTGSEYGWQGVRHFTMIFYNYVYASGQLVSYMIGKTLLETPTKKEIYKEILSLGITLKPKELLEKLGFDIESKIFWNQGFSIFEDRLQIIKKEWSELKK
jgi:oligoendopeptidase F